MNLDDKIKIINKIKEHIHNDKNGYCGVVWASRQIMGKDFNPKKWQVKSIASIITESGKYKKEKAEHKNYYDFDISLNPNSDWFKRNPIKTNLLKALIAIVISIITSIITTEIKLNKEQSNKMSNSKELNRQPIQSKLSPKEDSDSLNTSINH
ncbi:hypothetical protein J1D01_16935 [Seonamhaeicola sp. NFXS20]|uniref:hypothetical protein n=1 Tax=Seonamhaeicola sp. NFXS20 TaxID=2816959 RepID=UPI003B8D6C89